MIDCIVVLDDESGKWKCMVCGFTYAEPFRMNCRKPLKRRSEGEVAGIKESFCGSCKAYSHGMCLDLVRLGCNACKSGEDFDQKLASGIGCNRGLFGATEFETPGVAE